MGFAENRYLIQGPIFTFLLLFYNYFIISSLAYILEFKITTLELISIILILAIIRLVPLRIEMSKTHLITQYLSEFSNLWLWASFMYLFEIIILYFASFIVKIPFNIKLAIVLLVPLFGAIGYYIAHNNYINEHDIYLKEKSERKSKNISIIHISDMHIGSIRKKRTIIQLVRNINKIASEKDNVITIISGDAADGSCPILPDTFIDFKDVKTPVIFTPGNHDYYQGIDNVKLSLKNAGVTILDNENLILDDENLNIIGFKFSFNEKEQEEYTPPIANDKNNVLIYHVPLYWEEFRKIGVDLQLSGHTHGGQFFPATLFVGRQFKYNRGLFNKNNSYLSVTDGVGTFAPPIRLGTRSEIAVLNIHRES